MEFVVRKETMEAETIPVRKSTKERPCPFGEPEYRQESARDVGERQSESVPGEERHPSMRVRIPPVCLAATVILALAPAPMAGQTIPSPFRYVETKQEVGLLFGRIKADGGRFGFGPKGGMRLGGFWSVDLSGPLGFEAVGSVIRGKRDVINPARLEGDRMIGQADVLLGTLDGRLRFTFTGERSWHNLSPYILAGGGIVFDLSSTQAIDEQLDQDSRFDFGSSFLGSMGGGTRYYLTDRLVLRGDALFSLWKIDTPPGFSDPTLGILNVEKSEWASALSLTLSAAIRY